MATKYQVLAKLSASNPRVVLSAPATFDVPNTPAGIRLLTWWKTASRDERAELLNCAYANNNDVIAAHEKLSAAASSDET